MTAGAIYLDHNATAPLLPAAAAACAAAMSESGNPSSVHGFGRRARARLEAARQEVAALIGVPAAAVIFTSGATEANNMALGSRGERRLIVSAIEHESVLLPAKASGAAIIRVGRNGLVDLDHLAYLLDEDERPALVSLMLANNETGVVQPVAAAARLAKAKGALVHCDAVQAAGRIAIDMAALDIDYLSLSAHKLGGPQGVGALAVAPAAPLSPLLRGGGQERSRRAGTENVIGIAGFGAAAAAVADLAMVPAMRRLRDRLEEGLAALGGKATIFGGMSERLCNTSCFAAGAKTAESLVMAFDLAGIAISAGSACSSGKVRPSGIVQAMGFDAALAASAIRVSLGPATTAADIDAFLSAWARIHRIGAAGRKVQAA